MSTPEKPELAFAAPLARLQHRRHGPGVYGRRSAIFASLVLFVLLSLYTLQVAVNPAGAAIAADGVVPTEELLAAGTASGAFFDLALLATQTGPQLSALTGTAAFLEQRLASMDASALPAPLGALLLQSTSMAKLVKVAMQLRPEAPWLLGMDEPRHYLVLVQNNHELRATGGFISAVGLLTVEQGKITDLTFTDSYDFYRDGGQYPLAPEPMEQYMGIQLMLLRDANWWPDLPTSAQMARTLYGDHTDLYPDGVITIDLNAVKHLMGALETLDVPGSTTPITADNVEDQLIRFWDQPIGDGGGPPPDYEGNFSEWLAARKDFIPRLAEAAMQRIQTGAVSLPALTRSAQAALEDRSVQVWLNNETAAKVLADAHWDGALQPEAGADYLAVVDTNMGYNKVDAVLERSIDYQVAWDDDPTARAQATLTLTYTHPGPAGDPDCDPAPRYGESYVDMTARCYFNYIRVYAPAGSHLLAVDGVEPETVAAAQDPTDLEEFTAYFVLPTESTQTVTFSYELPAKLYRDEYRLIVQRQAGAPSLPMRVSVDDQQEDLMVTGGRLEWVGEK